jgi:hypothetical protein
VGLVGLGHGSAVVAGVKVEAIGANGVATGSASAAGAAAGSSTGPAWETSQSASSG